MTKTAIIGCGAISGIYFKNLSTQFDSIDLVACADLDQARAQAKAAEYPGVSVHTLDEILADDRIELIVNLTTPNGHYPIAAQAIAAGKHVYNEKPLCATREEGQALVAAAQAKGVRLGCAPDTFMGAGLQTSRKIIDDGGIGRPLAAHAFMLSPGMEHWHPNPEFYFKPGSGPMLDMGPYYLTALISLLGPVQRVSGSTSRGFQERIISSEPHAGQRIKVEVATHVSGLLEFVSGVVATITTSFDVVAAEVPRIEIFGSDGTLSLPDPNTFGGSPRIIRREAKEWISMPLTHPYAENSRGLGPADLAAAVRNLQPHRANGELALHVLDIMQSIHESAESGRHVELTTTCERPSAMPAKSDNESAGIKECI